MFSNNCGKIIFFTVIYKKKYVWKLQNQFHSNIWDELHEIISKYINRRWHISTTPNTTKKFCTPFKLIQQSNMVTLSGLAKKNQNLNPRKKSSVYYWKWRFPKVCGMKTQLSVMNWTFSSCSNFNISSWGNSGWPY